jgi:hypothetical protein
MSRLDRGGWALTLVGVVLLRFDGFIVYRPDLNPEEGLWPPLLELLAPVPAWLTVLGFDSGRCSR